MDAQRLRDGYQRLGQALATGDWEALGETFPEDGVWHFAGNSRMSGSYRGREQIVDMFKALMEHSGGTMRPELIDIVVGEDKAIFFTHMRAQREGKTLDMKAPRATLLDAEGRWKESWFVPSDQRSWNEFWS